MKCYNCHGEVIESEARTIAQAVIVCNSCYHELRTLIFNGYFDEPKLEDELIFESQVQTHLSARA